MVLNFEIDKLTNSIENAVSGEVFDTVITEITDVKEIKKTHWLFDWKIEIQTENRKVYKLTTINNPNIIQGLISLTDGGDHIYMDLIESAKFNKGKKKLYFGVAGNLVAFACKLSFEKGYKGIVVFTAKTKLIEHYKKTLGAQIFMGNRMFIDTNESLFLTKTYFNNFEL